MITILGRIPSKKNSVIAMVRGGRVIHIPSNAYRAWHKQACIQLQKFSKLYLRRAKIIHIKVFAPDARKSDLTNKAESIMDLLTDTGFIADDNWFIVPIILLQFAGIDRTNPRVEIYNGENPLS